MKKIKLFTKTILSATSIAAIALITLAPTNLNAGCIVVPDDKRGWCEKNTEGGFSCITSYWFRDCTSSGPPAESLPEG